MIVIPHAKNSGEKGKWWWFKESIVVSCPNCGTTARLNHEIDSHGIVTPSVQCEISTCDFHDMIKLEDYV